MTRMMGIMNAAIIVSRLACATAWAVSTDNPEPPPLPHTTPPGNSIEPTGTRRAATVRHLDHVRKLTVAVHKPAEPPADRSSALPPDTLTHQEQSVPDVAVRDGDREFPMAAVRRLHHARKFIVAAHKPIVAIHKPVEPPPDTLSALPPDTLTQQEQSVADVAVMNGDQKFLMVDKGLGKIVLFEDGDPVFLGNALTGASTADRMPPNETRQAMDKLNALDTKVTPAGRFTVTRGYDPDYGPLFDIKEIQGKDWGIAIHQVYLGIPSEHRAARLQSPRYDDKNITFGCINVAPETIRLLLRELPAKGATPLYVLPRDETKTAVYFSASTT